MGESHENLLKAVRHYQESLDKYTENRNDGKLLHYMERLYKLPIKVVHLEQTGVGRTVNGLRKLGGEVGDSAKSLVAKWKEMVVGEQEEEEDEEDGYQTGDDPSSDDKDDREEHFKQDTSSHRKSDNHRTADREKKSKSSRSEKKDRHKHKHNGHSSSSKHKSHKRKVEDSSSDEETVRKKPKKDSSEDEDNHRKKHKHEEEKKKKKPSASSSSSSEKHKDSVKDKHKSSKKEEGKKHEHKKEKKSDKSEGSKAKEHKNKDRSEKIPKKSITSTTNGIDSGSGASFAEALGMCEPEPSSSTLSLSSRKKKPSNGDTKKEKVVPKIEDAVPKLLKEPALEPIDINLSSLLPTITPNYRPLGNLMGLESQPQKKISDYEALSNIITSKNQRTKVYSGNKMGAGKVSSLFELCIRVLQDNIDALEYTGGVPYIVLKPILEKSNPNQLYALEHHNPYLIEDTDELWQLHCQKEFRNKRREEFESWREMYMRCLDERDAKLKALTANIKQAQDKSLPVRTTKLAYVETVAKPPRNIARKQAKNGTAFDNRKPAVTPAARLTALATAGKVAVPNPGSRVAERASSHAVKPKKAPLMLKSISSFKNRFKR